MKLLNFIIGSTLAQFDPFMSKLMYFVFRTNPAKLYEIFMVFLLQIKIMTFQRHVFYTTTGTFHHMSYV